MSPSLKKLLKAVNIYYPAQGFYRCAIFSFNRIKIEWQYRRYKGEGYICNYCGATYTKFAPLHPGRADKDALARHEVIAGYGENILCPNCLSTARERLLKIIATHFIQVEGKKILHISPEKKFYDFISDKSAVFTVDLYPKFYTRIDPSVQFADATGFSFENDMFDIVVGNHIMEHIPDDTKAIKEIYRVIRPGGNAILQVPFSLTITHTIEEPGIDNPGRQSALFGQHDHLRIYSLNSYLEKLRNAGFMVEYLPYKSLGKFYPYAIQKGEGIIIIRK